MTDMVVHQLFERVPMDITPLGHIFLIRNQPIFALYP
jgi:hypothetical protein